MLSGDQGLCKPVMFHRRHELNSGETTDEVLRLAGAEGFVSQVQRSKEQPQTLFLVKPTTATSKKKTLLTSSSREGGTSIHPSFIPTQYAGHAKHGMHAKIPCLFDSIKRRWLRGK
jgi:hypothetical protein